jgi:hypothetical protein
VQVRPRKAIAVVGSAIVIGLVGASSAVAATQPLEASFHLKGSHHYAINGLGFPSYATLTASGGHGSAQYIGTKGQDSGFAGAKRMVSDLGSRGGYDLRFHAKRTKMIDPPKGCTGKQAKARIGVWKGTIKFRGEGGYTSVDATRAPGRVVPEHSLWDCGQQVKGTQLLVVGGGPPPPPVQFTAFKPDQGSTTSFTATDSETLPAKAGVTVQVRREVAVNGTSGQFIFNDALTRAQVNPPAPFSGTGTFGPATSTHLSWNGSLAVDFPGAPNFALHGASNWGGGLGHGKFFQP